MQNKKTDMKAGLGVKPALSHIDYAPKVYVARTMEYGDFKYEFGNYLREPPEGVSDVERLLGYISAAERHLSDVTLSIKRYIGQARYAAPTLQEAVYAADKGNPEKGDLGSGLPGLCGAITSLAMAIQQAVDAKLLPEDPGRPWLNIYKEHPVKDKTRYYLSILTSSSNDLLSQNDSFNSNTHSGFEESNAARADSILNEFTEDERKLANNRK